MPAAAQEELGILLDLVLERLYTLGYRRFYSGGARGLDTLAAEAVLRLRGRYPDAALILALPCADQDRNWNRADRARLRGLAEQADRVTVLAPAYYEGCMQARNRYMVDRSAFCVCYLRHMRGGTMSTVAYAVKEGRPVLNLAIAGDCRRFAGEEG